MLMDRLTIKASERRFATSVPPNRGLDHPQRKSRSAPTNLSGWKIAETVEITLPVILAVRNVLDAEEGRTVKGANLGDGRGLHIFT